MNESDLQEHVEQTKPSSKVLPNLNFDKNLIPLITGLVSIAIVSKVIMLAVNSKVRSDIPMHSILISELVERSHIFYSSWYYMQWAIVGSGQSQVKLLSAATILLTLLYFLKGYTIGYFHSKSDANPWIITALSVMLCFVIALPWPNENAYLGTFQPFIFHSATQLVAAVFGLIAIVLTCNYASIDNLNRPSLVTLSIATALSSLAKPAITPSLLSAQLIVTVVYVFQGKISFREMKLFAFLVSIPSAAIFLTGYLYTYEETGVRSAVTIRIVPFAEWGHLSNSIVVDSFRSLAFPLATLICLWWWNKEKPSPRLTTAWLVLLISLIPLSLFAEVDDATGQVIGAGNFIWGPMIANSGLYLISSIEMLAIRKRNTIPAFIVLGIQAVAGLIYIVQYIETGAFK